VPAGKFKPVVLILKLSESVRVPVILKIKMNWLNRVMLLPAANGLVPVKAVKAPPLKLPATLAEGMLSPAPSVSAAAEVVKYAYSFTLPNRNGTVQEVVILTGALPVEMPLRRRAKLTKPGAAVIVTELFSAALRFTLAVLDFSWALAVEGIRTRMAVNDKRAIPPCPKNLFSSVSLR